MTTSSISFKIFVIAIGFLLSGLFSESAFAQRIGGSVEYRNSNPTDNELREAYEQGYEDGYDDGSEYIFGDGQYEDSAYDGEYEGSAYEGQYEDPAYDRTRQSRRGWNVDVGVVFERGQRVYLRPGYYYGKADKKAWKRAMKAEKKAYKQAMKAEKKAYKQMKKAEKKYYKQNRKIDW